MKSKGRSKIHPATVTVWAAIMAAASMLPSFPILGGGGNFSISYALAPLAGVMFGPWAGGLSALIGDLIGSLIAPHTANIGIFTCLIGTANAMAAGFISRKKWWVPALFILAGAGVWLSFPAAREAWIYSINWVIGIVMALLGGTLGCKWFYAENALKRLIGMYLVVWPGYIVAQVINANFSIILYDLPADLLKVLTFTVPLERSIFAVGAVIIGIPLLVGLPKIGIFVGPEYDAGIAGDRLDAEMAAEYANKK